MIGNPKAKPNMVKDQRMVFLAHIKVKPSAETVLSLILFNMAMRCCQDNVVRGVVLSSALSCGLSCGLSMIFPGSGLTQICHEVDITFLSDTKIILGFPLSS